MIAKYALYAIAALALVSCGNAPAGAGGDNGTQDTLAVVKDTLKYNLDGLPDSAGPQSTVHYVEEAKVVKKAMQEADALVKEKEEAVREAAATGNEDLEYIANQELAKANAELEKYFVAYAYYRGTLTEEQKAEVDAY